MRAKKFEFNENINTLEVDPRFIADGLAFAERKKYRAIRIRALAGPNWIAGGPLDLTPLSGNKSVRSLTISDGYRISKANVDAIYGMKGLKELSCHDRKIKLDFSRLTQLEKLHTTYHGVPVGFSFLRKLRFLHMRSLKTRDCAPLEGLVALRELWLILGTVQTLSGIELLQNLVDVTLAHSPKLVDASALATLKRLANLHVEKCKRLTDYSFLSGADGIEDLFISDVDSLSFVPKMKRLRKLKFWNLKDGDITPVSQSKSLKDVYFYPEKRHYSHTRAEIARSWRSDSGSGKRTVALSRKGRGIPCAERPYYLPSNRSRRSALPL